MSPRSATRSTTCSPSRATAASALPVAERLERLLEELRAAERRSSRPHGSVRLLPVSKGQPLELVQEALGLGLLDLGENYVQECASKAAQVASLGLAPRWHLLGHLQSNKAQRAAQLFTRLESLDSLSLAQRLSRFRESGEPLAVLAEVDFTEIPGRHGYRPQQLEADLETLSALPGIRLQGLMTVADPQQPAQTFSACRELAERLRSASGQELGQLSMGMSHDFKEAVAEGSTEVRIGSLLFGPRG